MTETSENYRGTAAEFHELMSRVRAGSQEAAWDLIEYYGPLVLRVVRRQLRQQLRRRLDSMDIVQAVWLTFFRDRAALCAIDDPDSLVALLARAAVSKVIDEARKSCAAKRDIRREATEFDEVHATQSNSSRAPLRPSQFAIARERWDTLVRSCSERDRQIIDLKYEGATFVEIALRLGIDERTARRVVIRVFREQVK